MKKCHFSFCCSRFILVYIHTLFIFFDLFINFAILEGTFPVILYTVVPLFY